MLLDCVIAPALGSVQAGGGETFPDDKIEIDWDDKAAMQRGARTLRQLLHGLSRSRHIRATNRVGADLGISDDLLRDNLIFHHR